MATYRVVYQGSGSPASGIKVGVSFNGGGIKDGRTDKNGYVTISGSGITGKIFVNGREVHNGNLMHNFEFMI
jgi:hypothetical protein